MTKNKKIQKNKRVDENENSKKKKNNEKILKNNYGSSKKESLEKRGLSWKHFVALVVGVIGCLVAFCLNEGRFSTKQIFSIQQNLFDNTISTSTTSMTKIATSTVTLKPTTTTTATPTTTAASSTTMVLSTTTSINNLSQNDQFLENIKHMNVNIGKNLTTENESETENNSENSKELQEEKDLIKNVNSYLDEDLHLEINRKMQKQIKKIHQLIEQKSARESAAIFHEKLLVKEDDLWSRYGKMKALSIVAKEEKDATALDLSLDEGFQILGMGPFSEEFSYLVTRECLEMLEIVQHQDSEELMRDILSSLLDMFPSDVHSFRELCLHLFQQNFPKAAKLAFIILTERDSSDDKAKLILGVLYKKLDQNNQMAIDLMLPIFLSNPRVAKESLFVVHLGDALTRTGRLIEAKHIYEKGVEYGSLISPWQHSIVNYMGLLNKVWWKKEELSLEVQNLITTIESSWEKLVFELKRFVDVTTLNNHLLFDTGEGVSEKGIIYKIPLFTYGIKNDSSCSFVRISCRFFINHPKVTSCKHCKISLLVLEEGTRYSENISPSNTRLRADFPVSVDFRDKLKVRGEGRFLNSGKFIIYDPSFDVEWRIFSKKEEDNELDPSLANDEEMAQAIGGPFLDFNRRVFLSFEFWHPELQQSSLENLNFL